MHAPLLLTVYTRAGCHLCTDMQRELVVLQQRYPFTIELIDIDNDVTLKQRYNTRVPVLAVGETELCYYFLEEESLEAYFREL
ncbi:glutaredoxin family protein [Beggiatoa leptomitoformis]|uniref:Glutaredoxin family protein n=1 Tax=Beggiatoa leptomitoformis TaxID=288004 RepID=A0A2N9YC17_9GAMM|nr:glutaredoxin family protein [Beggiatoa leptomitoformis]ALG66679.1 glutaredoxin family protein [Beggiatoa leptomitoformis]AUI67996.1 glutaredoxin family protein [Beggiatoa leptomitoformis]